MGNFTGPIILLSHYFLVSFFYPFTLFFFFMTTLLQTGDATRLLAGSQPQSRVSGWGRAGHWLLAAATLISGSHEATAQTAVAPSPTTSIVAARFPLSTSNGYTRSAIIYRAADIRAAGGSITKMEFYLNSFSSPGAVPLRIYMKATSAIQFNANTTVVAEETGATLVYDATLPATAFATAGSFVAATFATPYVYNTCDNLEVIIETNAGGTGNETATSKTFGYGVVNGGRNAFIAWYADTTPPTGNQQVSYTTYSPYVRFTGIATTAAPDAGVMQVLTQNKILLPASGGAAPIVKAQVRNFGAALSSVPVTLSVVNGSYTYTNTQTVTLAANAVTTVTFAAYSPVPTVAGIGGTVTVTVAAAGDTYSCNNSMTETQDFSATDMSYVTPGVLSLSGRGFAATIYPNAYAFEAKFTTATARNITAVRARFSNDAASVGQTIYGVIANSSTGATIVQSPGYVILASDLDGLTIHTFTLTTPVTLAAGTYLAGMAQTYPNGTATSYFPMGTEPEYQGRGTTFYTSSPTAPTTPGDIGTATTVEYKFPIELVTDVAPACGAVTSVAASSITNTTANITFTAPGGATNYTVTATPAGGGTAVTATPTASPAALTGLTSNTTYNVTVVSNCSGGLMSSSSTTTFSTGPDTDASTLVLYTQGQLPIPYGNLPHVVSAVVKNNSATATPVSATLTVTGPGGFSFTDTETSASLATGATATLTFAGYTPTITGAYTVTVATTLTGDQIASNNSQSLTQTVNTTTFAYSSANAVPVTGGSIGYGTGSGTVVSKFTTTASRLITAVNVNLDASAVGKTVYGVVLSSTGALLGRSANFVPTAAGLTTFTLQTPVTMAAGSFLAGLAQVANTTAYYPVNAEAENPTRLGAYYGTAVGGGTPTDEGSANLGRPIIEALTTNVPSCGQVSALTLTTQTDTSLGIGFTPPAGTTGATYTVTLTPTTGAPVSQTVSASPATITGLTPGTSYTVSVVTNCAGSAGMSAATTGTTATLADLVVSTPQTVGGTYYNVTVTGTGSITGFTANLTVSGVITVQNGGSVHTDLVYYINGTGSFVLQAGGSLIEPNVAGIVNSALGGFNFSSTNPLHLSTDANYTFAGTAAQVTGALMPTTARNLTVNNSAGVTLTNALAISQLVSLQSGNLITGGKVFTLLSVAGQGTALIDNTGGIVSGTGTMQRAIDPEPSNGENIGYHHYSSPVASTTINDLTATNFAPVFNTAYNTAAIPTQIRPFPTVFGYDETRVSTLSAPYLTPFDLGYFSPSGTDTWPVGHAYTANVANAALVDFVGTFNNGTITISGLTRGTDPNAGWQLLGNPYPSPLDWSSVATSQLTNLDATIYQYHAASRYSGSFTSYLTNGVSNTGTGAQPLVDAGAGFFAHVTTAGTPAALSFTNANRITTFSTQPFFGRQATTRTLLSLQVSGATGGTPTDAIAVYADPQATTGVDPNYDAVKLSNPTGLNLAALAGATALSINGLPSLTATSAPVPLRLGVPAAGNYTFTLTGLNNFGTTQVWLLDAQTGTQHLLTGGSTYAFSIANPTLPTTRFSLVFRPSGVTATTATLTAAQVSLYPNPAHSSFSLLLPPVAGQKEVRATLLNALGQTVLTRTIPLNAAGATAEFNTAALAQGVYMLRLEAGTETLIQRLVVE